MGTKRKRKAAKKENEEQLPTSGINNHGEPVEPLDTFWNSAMGQDFYTPAADYWKRVESTIDGVMGGFGHLTGLDIAGSAQFLSKILKDIASENEQGKTREQNIKKGEALDAGGGVGRVSSSLLLKFCARVHLVEPNENFLETAKKEIGTERASYDVLGLQEFFPKPGRYSIIWIQWVSSHLTDTDFVKFFERCKPALAEGGILVVKENVAKEKFVIDMDDSSITRTEPQYEKLFGEAGWKVKRKAPQSNWPKGMFGVTMWWLDFKDAKEPDSSNSEIAKEDPK